MGFVIEIQILHESAKVFNANISPHCMVDLNLRNDSKSGPRCINVPHITSYYGFMLDVCVSVRPSVICLPILISFLDDNDRTWYVH